MSMLQATEFYAPAAAANIKFCHGCGRTLHKTAPACPDCGTVQAAMVSNRRSRSAAALLALGLGGIGAHKLYLGRIRPALIYLAFSWTLVPALVAVGDAIRLFRMSDEAFISRYDR
jgi:TM2 domain-containing membrane protein YozV